MKILILTQNEIEQLLTMPECIELVADALAGLARGEVFQPFRKTVIPPGAAGVIATMPAYRGGDRAAFGLKAICVFPDNPLRGLDSHQGAVMLFSAETGQLLSMMNASAITAIRTAAASAVATRLLAREDAAELAIIGSGVQARTHLEAMACVRRIKRARVASKTFDHAKKLVDDLRGRYDFALEAVQTNEEAARGADLIVTATTAAEPVIKREWISSGAHLNVVGSSIPDKREVDTQTLLDARLFVDSRESAEREAGEYIISLAEGAFGPEHILGELGELLTGAVKGRSSRDDITIFKSLGIGIEDLASADYLYRIAKEKRAGTWVEF